MLWWQLMLNWNQNKIERSVNTRRICSYWICKKLTTQRRLKERQCKRRWKRFRTWRNRNSCMKRRLRNLTKWSRSRLKTFKSTSMKRTPSGTRKDSLLLTKTTLFQMPTINSLCLKDGKRASWSRWEVWDSRGSKRSVGMKACLLPQTLWQLWLTGVWLWTNLIIWVRSLLTKIRLTFTSKRRSSKKSRSSLKRIGALCRKWRPEQQPHSTRRRWKRLRKTNRPSIRTSGLRGQKSSRKTIIRQRLRKRSNLPGRRTLTLQKKLGIWKSKTKSKTTREVKPCSNSISRSWSRRCYTSTTKLINSKPISRNWKWRFRSNRSINLSWRLGSRTRSMSRKWRKWRMTTILSSDYVYATQSIQYKIYNWIN
jgi:hypothetical protein